MAYLTAGELEQRVGTDDFSAVADQDGDGIVESNAVSDAINDASAEIDSYLAVRYAMPLSGIPITVKRACVDISMYRLAGNKTTEEAEKRYLRAVAWLRDVSKGLAGLGDVADDSASGGSAFSAGTRVHTRTRLQGGF